MCYSNFCICGRNPIVLPFKWNLLDKTFGQYYLNRIILQNEFKKKKIYLISDWEACKTTYSKLTNCGLAAFKSKLITIIVSHLIFTVMSTNLAWRYYTT